MYQKIVEYAAEHKLSKTDVALQSLRDFCPRKIECCGILLYFVKEEATWQKHEKRRNRGRALRKGEVQRAFDKRYMYTYTDPLGRRKFIYANDLAELREKERKLIKDQLDGLDLYVAGKATVNDTFDRYLSDQIQAERNNSQQLHLYV